MRNLIFLMVLAGVCNIAMAEMLEIGKGSVGETVSVDPTTMHKVGNSVTIWSQINSTTPQALPGHSPYLSKVTQVQLDCAGKVTRTLYTNYYSAKEGKGNKIFFEDLSTLLSWKPVLPGTSYETVFKFGCDKK